MIHRKYIRATAEERRRITAMMKLGCVACAHLGIPNIELIECHHLVEGNKRLGHWYSIPLCIAHHRGGLWPRFIPEDQRVSISDGRKAFTRIYPIERMLWERVQRRLKLPVTWPDSKIVPRRA